MASVKCIIRTASCSALLLGCSGGSGTNGGPIEGLAAPSQISVISASTSAAVPALGALAAESVPLVPESSDYATDTANTWVYDPSMDALSIVNEILCLTSGTAYSLMVNQGLYNAQIDTAKCQNGGEGGGNQSSGANQNELSVWVVDSSRASNTSDEVVNFWIPDLDGEGSENIIHAQMRVSEGAGDANPFGVFSMNFAGIPDGGQISEAELFGYLRTMPTGSGQVGFQFFLVNGDVNQVPASNDHAEEVAVTVTMTDDLTEGNARIRRLDRRNDSGGGGDTGIQTSEYLVAFDATHMKRQLDSDDPVVLSRLDFESSAWRYNLYAASGPNAGTRIARDSGFNFTTLAGEYGYIGYYGMWSSPGVDIQSGDTVLRREYGSETEVPYTILRAPGKLIRYERNELDILELAGVPLEWWDYMAGTNYQVECDGSAFWRVASRASGSEDWTTIVPELIDVAALGGYLNMWSSSLGGSVSWVDGDDFVTYYAQTFVSGADPVFDSAVNGTLVLYGLVDCLGAGLTAAQAETGQVFLPNANSVSSPLVYRFQQDDLTLYNDADGSGSTLTRTGLADGEVPMSGPFTWGLRSGPLFVSTSGLVDVWNSWSQPEFYIYETGPNSWNQYATAVNLQGQTQAFDAPLQFTYTHELTNDLNDDAAFAGKKYLLSYGGDGNLWGIPSQPVDLDGNGGSDRWVPLFGLKDGTLVGPTGSEYLVRAIETEQRLIEDLAGAPGLDLAPSGDLDLPQGGDYVAPDMGPRPVLSSPPAVIDGVVQGG